MKLSAPVRKSLGVVSILGIIYGAWLYHPGSSGRSPSSVDASSRQGKLTYVGAAVCKSCHPKTFNTWRQSAHGRHMARPSTATVAGDFENKNTYDYQGTRSRMFRVGDDYFMEHTRNGETGRYRIEWVLGVIRHQVYLWRDTDGRLQVLPTYWNIEQSHWRDSTEGPVDGDGPTKETDADHWSNFGRTFQVSCMECHASRAKKNYDPKSNTYSSVFEPSIDCEACHGPASDHVWSWRSLNDLERAPLGSSAGLTSDARILRCARCHARKRVYQQQSEGTSFYDAFSPTLWGDGHFFADGRSSTLNYRFVDYMQSRCMTPVQQKMPCEYCHPAHSLESRREATVVQSNQLCTECHIKYKNELVSHTHHPSESEGSRCIECHMPRTQLDLQMTVRDHTIGSPLPELTRDFGSPNACNGCHSDQSVDWAVRWTEKWYGNKASFRDYRARLRERAQVLSASFEGRPPVDLLAQWLDQPKRSLIERASAAQLLGRAAPAQDAYDVLYRHRADPHPLVRYAIVRSMAPFVRRETIEALRQALTDERAIVRVDAYGSLVFLQPDIETSTDPTVVRARREYRYRQEFIRADDPRWLANFVEWHFGRGEIEHAEKYARHALRLAPRDPLHWANLATLLLATNRLPEATEHAERLSQLDPKGARTGVVLSSILLALGRPRDAFIKIQEFDQKDPHVQRMTTVIRARIRSGF